MRGTFLEEMMLLKAGVDVEASELGCRAWWLRERYGVGVSMQECEGKGVEMASPMQRQRGISLPHASEGGVLEVLGRSGMRGCTMR